MKHNDYWRERFLQLEQAQHRLAEGGRQQIEQLYRQAQRELDGQIAVWYQRLAENNEISLAEARRWLNADELAEFKWDVQEYIKFGEQNAIDGRWTKQLENASARFHISRLEALKIRTRQSLEQLFAGQQGVVGQTLGEVYRSGYYHTAFELQRGFSIGWDIAAVDERRLAKVLAKPWAADGRNFSERIWGNRDRLVNELHNELTRSIMLGQEPQKAIDALAKKMQTSRSNAGRLIMTEQAYFSSAAQRDCFTDLGVERFEIVATLDSHTSEICREADGQVRPMSEFEPGVTAPPFHVNCRSTTVPYFDDEFTQGWERAARDENGKTYYVPADMTYKEWAKAFTEGDKSGIIKEKLPFVPAATIQEAEEFARNNLGVLNVSYRGVDVVTANAWNEGLYDTFTRFPELKNNFGFVGEAHERNAMLKPVARQYFLDELLKLNPGFTVTDLEPYADKKLKSFMKALQVGKNTFAQSWAPSHDIFAAFRGVSVNRDWGKKSAVFVNALQENVQSKFHPIGCDTIRSVLDHEIGHQLDNLLNISDIDEIKKLFDSRTHAELTEALSTYAWNNNNKNRYGEMIAEAWAEYCNNPEPREIAQAVGTIIEKEYRKKF